MIECKPRPYYDTWYTRRRMEGEILIGCAGYSYDDWKENFYPAEVPATKRLEYYSRHFPLVEINFTYYRMPTKASFARSYERTNGDTIFNVKLHQNFTHTREISESDVVDFDEALKPLKDNGIFGCLLAQFPFSFRPEKTSFDWLYAIKSLFPDVPLVVEFRNGDWADASVHDFLKKHGIAYCIVDEPNLRGLMPSVTWITSDIAYIRFHGRNAEKWWNPPDSSKRYDYLYSDDELHEWVKKILKIRSECEKMYVIMNNHFSGNAVRNAKTLQLMLGLESVPLENPDRGRQEMMFG